MNKKYRESQKVFVWVHQGHACDWALRSRTSLFTVGVGRGDDDGKPDFVEGEGDEVRGERLSLSSGRMENGLDKNGGL